MDLSIAYSKLCNMESDLRKLNGGNMKERLPECIGSVTIQALKDPTGFLRLAINAYEPNETAVTLDAEGFSFLLDELNKLYGKTWGVETMNFDAYETELPMDDDEMEEQE